ncbi:MAG: LLM class F420-dependent oxidoreductase [Actinobacteria bacterium]|nr:LLM class F420-dependent oxidoreductase [Actinomycetota bacterium]
MRFGITMFVTDTTMGPGELAREAEDRGFDSIFFPEHTHIPISRTTPAPMGEPLPEQYRRTMDPFVALTVAACATTKIRLGTGICLVAERDPIVTAKEVASLDHVSGGRFVFGIGFGWNVEEMTDHGVDFRQRREITRECMLAMEALWTQNEASFDGEFVRFEPSWAWPKPVQQPRPPVLIGGGAGPKLFAHIAEYADGWIPIGARGVAAALPELRAAFEKAGRDPSNIEIVPCGSIPDPKKLEYFQSVGVTEVVVGITGGYVDEILPVLDDYAKTVAAFR